MGRHTDADGDGVADQGTADLDVEVCDERPRDPAGWLLDGLPSREVGDGY